MSGPAKTVSHKDGSLVQMWRIGCLPKTDLGLEAFGRCSNGLAIFNRSRIVAFHSFFCLAASSCAEAHLACSCETKDSILSASSTCAVVAVE